MGGLLHLVLRGRAWAGWPSPLLAVPNVTAHPSTASVYNFILFDVANITLKGKQQQSTRNQTIQYRTHEIHEEQLQCQEQVEKLIYKFFYSNGNRQVQCVSDTCPTWDQVISRSIEL